MMPLVSVITPCYNSEKYISRYLDCIIAQSYSNIQLIIVNDGSIDNTEKIIFDYQDRLLKKGIKVTYKYQENKGLGGAINTGLKLVEGEFFTWCDSDNLLTPDYFEENAEYFLEHPEAAIVRCDGYNVLDTDIHAPISKMSDGIKNKNEKHLFMNCLTAKEFYFGCTMLRLSAFEAVNPSREIYESREGQNWQIMLPMFYRYESHYIDKPMFFFVIREDSISHAAALKGYEEQVKQNNECERIEEITIRSMHIIEEDEYIGIIHKQYAIIRFWLADKYQKTEKMDIEYNFLKQNGWTTNEIEKAHRRWHSWIWRAFQLLRRFG